MDNCIDFLELISAYIDGEISESDLQHLQAHLSACERCSAMLGLYKEMSAAVAESTLPAPDSLCANVMERVRSEGNSSESANGSGKKKQKSPIIEFRRYIPAVACLVVVLIALPLILINRPDENYYVAAPVFRAFSSVEEAETQTGSADMPVAMGGGATQNWAAPGSAVPDGGDIHVPAAAPAPILPPAPVPESEPEPALTNRLQESLLDEMDSDENFEFGTYGTEAQVMEPFSDSEELDALRMFHELISESYAVIDIAGVLPEILHAFEPVPLGKRVSFAWEKAFRVPRDVAQYLIDMVEADDGDYFSFANIERVNPDSEYGVVLYTPG